MRKGFQSLVMLLMASSLMPLMARPHHKPHFKHHDGPVVHQVCNHGYHVRPCRCKPYGYDYASAYVKSCRPRRPLARVCPVPVHTHCEPRWGSDVIVVRPKPRLEVSVNF